MMNGSATRGRFDQPQLELHPEQFSELELVVYDPIDGSSDASAGDPRGKEQRHGLPDHLKDDLNSAVNVWTAHHDGFKLHERVAPLAAQIAREARAWRGRDPGPIELWASSEGSKAEIPYSLHRCKPSPQGAQWDKVDEWSVDTDLARKGVVCTTDYPAPVEEVCAELTGKIASYVEAGAKRGRWLIKLGAGANGISAPAPWTVGMRWGLVVIACVVALGATAAVWVISST